MLIVLCPEINMAVRSSHPESIRFAPQRQGEGGDREDSAHKRGIRPDPVLSASTTLPAALKRDWIAGCAMWMRRTALAGIGLFDETFFAYHEEVDWCVRARSAGWRVLYCPGAVVTHTGRGGRRG